MPHRLGTLAALGLLTSLTACGPSVPDAWAAFVPKDNLTMALGEEDSGGVKKIALNYKKEGMTGDQLRGKFTTLIEKGGFKKLSECVSENGTSSAMFISDSKEVFQVAINLLGAEFYDVGLDRGTGLPGVELPNPADCKFTDVAKDVCEDASGDRCKFK